MKEYKKLYRYGLLRRFKRGAEISISPTFRCNYHCSYCSMNLPNGKRKISKEVDLNQWLAFIDNFPVKLREVVISGGEPTLVDYFADLVNALTARGLMVTVFTNLSNDKLFGCHPSWRLRIATTFHEQAKGMEFTDRVLKLRRAGYQITVEEIGQSVLPIKTDVKPLLTNGEETRIYTMLRVGPDLRMYISCYDLFN